MDAKTVRKRHDSFSRYFRVTFAPLVRKLSMPLRLKRGLPLLALLLNTAQAQSPHWDEIRQKTEARLQEIASTANGVVSYSIVDLTDGQRFEHHADWVFPQGSAIKIPVLMEVYKQAHQGRFKLSDPVAVGASEQVGGSGVLKELGDGSSQLSIRDLAVLMILVSDNTATNMLINRVGMERINQTMQSLGLPQTRVQRLMMDAAARGRGDENLSTAAEAAHILEMLYKGEFLDAAACQDMLSILQKRKSGAIRAGLPADLPVSFKPGGIPGVSTEWAIVHLRERPYIVVVMGNYGLENEFAAIMRQISRTAYDYFWRLGRASRYGTYVDPKLIRK